MAISDFDFYFEDFMLFCTSKNLATKTLKSYDQTLKLFSLYLQKEFTINSPMDVRASHIRHYIKYLQERGKYTVQTANSDINFPHNRTDNGKDLSPNTINNYIRNIKVFFNYLYEERVLKENPVERINFLKKRDKIKESLNEDEVNSILKKFDNTTFHGYRDYMITRLLLTVGCRLGETLSIHVEDIDFKHRTILFKDTKNKKERLGYLTNKLTYDLKKWIGYKERYLQTELLFPTNRGTKLQLSSYERALRNASIKANIDNVHPHRLRACFSMEFLKNGGSIYVLSKLLDHSSVEVTRLYLNFTEKELRKEFLKYNPMQNMNY